ncbi:MAG: hypothetical protein AVDCRST_MAG93-1138, partial [uncultured Chloroflexia bacterium]
WVTRKPAHLRRLASRAPPPTSCTTMVSTTSRRSRTPVMSAWSSSPIQLSEYGSLAAAGSLDRLATKRGRQEVTFTA